MPTILAPAAIETLGDLLNRLGGIPADRVRFRPTPGEATEQDCFEAKPRVGVLCELIDGTLVEKTMGLYESILAGILLRFISEFVSARKLGVVAAPDGMFRVAPHQIRMPDVSFTSWERLPSDLQSQAAVDLAPDLAIEILSPGNTAAEITRKREEYFSAGTRLMWIVDPVSRSIAVYTSPQSEPRVLTEDQVVDGGTVLPGFSFSIRALFAEAERPRR